MRNKGYMCNCYYIHGLPYQKCVNAGTNINMSHDHGIILTAAKSTMLSVTMLHMGLI
jgi:hypothetical protein